MKACKKCFRQNLDTANFCVGCGVDLTGNFTQKTGTTIRYDHIESRQSKKISVNTVFWAAILIAGSSVAAYFIFMKQSSASTTEKPIVKSEELVSNEFARSESKAVPMKEQAASISETEVSEISRLLNEFYDYETKEDVGALLSFYQFPINQYYQHYNVEYTTLKDMVIEAFNGKLYYHQIDIKWHKSTVKKLGDGNYKAMLNADYTSSSADQSDARTKQIYLTIILNRNYKITSIYPTR